MLKNLNTCVEKSQHPKSAKNVIKSMVLAFLGMVSILTLYLYSRKQSLHKLLAYVWYLKKGVEIKWFQMNTNQN